MTSAQDYLFKYSKWLIFLLAYLFLGYKLFTFDGYEALLTHFSSVSFHDYLFLFFVFLLLPINLLFEVLKWQRLVAGLQPISLGLAFLVEPIWCSTGFCILCFTILCSIKTLLILALLLLLLTLLRLFLSSLSLY